MCHVEMCCLYFVWGAIELTALSIYICDCLTVYLCLSVCVCVHATKLLHATGARATAATTTTAVCRQRFHLLLACGTFSTCFVRILATTTTTRTTTTTTTTTIATRTTRTYSIYLKQAVAADWQPSPSRVAGNVKTTLRNFYFALAPSPLHFLTLSLSHSVCATGGS